MAKLGNGKHEDEDRDGMRRTRRRGEAYHIYSEFSHDPRIPKTHTSHFASLFSENSWSEHAVYDKRDNRHDSFRTNGTACVSTITPYFVRPSAIPSFSSSGFRSGLHCFAGEKCEKMATS